MKPVANAYAQNILALELKVQRMSFTALVNAHIWNANLLATSTTPTLANVNAHQEIVLHQDHGTTQILVNVSAQKNH